MLPLLLLLRHERNETRVFSQVTKVGITLKKRMGSLHRLLLPTILWPIHKRLAHTPAPELPDDEIVRDGQADHKSG